MEEKVLTSIGGVGMYGVISICIFFAFFSGMLLWVCCQKKSRLDSFGAMPLEDEAAPRDETNQSKSE